MSDDLLRDKIVVGILDELSEKLQLDDQLTFEKALSQVRSKELIAKQSALLREQPIAAQADYVKSRDRQASNANRQKSNASRRTSTDKSKTCSRCGKPSHPIKECLAKDAKYGKCRMVGHWQKFCRTRMTSLK